MVNEGHYRFVVEQTESASSSIVLPNTYGAGQSIAPLLNQLPSLFGVDVESKPTLYVREEDVLTTELKNTFNVEVVSSPASLQPSSETTFLYVGLGSEISDSTVSKTMETVQKLSGGDFVAFTVPTQYESSFSAGTRRLETVDANLSLNLVRCTPNIMLGLLVSFFLTYMLYMGFTTMMDIRSNDQFWLEESAPIGHKVEN